MKKKYHERLTDDAIIFSVIALFFAVFSVGIAMALLMVVAGSITLSWALIETEPIFKKLTEAVL